MPLADPPQWFREDMHFHSLDRAVRLRHCGDADERVVLDVGHRPLHGRDDRGTVFELDCSRRAASRFDRERIAVHLIERTTQPRGRRVFRVSGGCAEHTSCHGGADPDNPGFPQHTNLL